jgi:HK97 family phage prohead protease
VTDLIYRATPVDVKAEGRTVEAYAAVFRSRVPIVDHQGEYDEEIEPTAFNRAIGHLRPQGGRKDWRVGVFYNHAMTLHGTPSERFSVPIARATHIEADSTGLLTVAEYADTPTGGEILDLIKAGIIRAQSFTGAIYQSDPQLARGQRHRPGRDGIRPLVRRQVLGLREFGPTPVPAYEDAEIVGVRAALLRAVLEDPAAIRSLLAPTLTTGVADPDDDPDAGQESEAGTGSAGEPPASDAQPETPPEGAGDGHATRSDWQRGFDAALRARGIL